MTLGGRIWGDDSGGRLWGDDFGGLTSGGRLVDDFRGIRRPQEKKYKRFNSIFNDQFSRNR